MYNVAEALTRTANYGGKKFAGKGRRMEPYPEQFREGLSANRRIEDGVGN